MVGEEAGFSNFRRVRCHNCLLKDLPSSLSPEKAGMLTTITESLRNVPNVAAIVLGGSHASGLARVDSDIDLGIYYREAHPFAVSDVRFIAERVSLSDSVPVVTEFYGWGPWVNGGAWIQTRVGKVDFLFREIDRVRSVIEEGRAGIWRHDYDQQPPYGFRSVVYFGETHICVPLHDPDDEIAQLKQAVAEYPKALKDRIVQDSLWLSEFSLLFCRKFSSTADVYNATGCMTRIAQFLMHALFALNNEYFVSDKYANRLLDGFRICPLDFTARLARILSKPGSNSAELGNSCALLSALWQFGSLISVWQARSGPLWSSACVFRIKIDL
jgi:predicted nucleotidyltransferase